MGEPARRCGRAASRDNRTFRLGPDLAVRLPSAVDYRTQVDEEQRWLPFLAPHVPLPIPVPRAHGAPGAGYPFSLSVHGWLAGEPAVTTQLTKPSEVARSLARFLVALQQVDHAGGPPRGSIASGAADR